MQQLPVYVSIVFIATTFLTLYFFYKVLNKNNKLITVFIVWLLLQAVLAKAEFYLQFKAIPPRILFALLPSFIAIVLLFTTKKGKVFIDSLNVKYLTILNIIRIPVEIVLLWLFLNKTVPQSMTFEGQNFDIISGITAPVIYYLFFVKKQLHKSIFITWNILCLLLVLNVVITGVLSTPLPFQQFAFQQPNIAVFYFPFIWLPAFIVPVVIFSHLALLRKTIINKL